MPESGVGSGRRCLGRCLETEATAAGEWEVVLPTSHFWMVAFMASFMSMFIGGFALTYLHERKFLDDNPVLRASGNNNICVVIDHGYARMLAAIMWPIALILYVLYGFTTVLEIKTYGVDGWRRKVHYVGVAMGLLLWCCFGLAISIPPTFPDERDPDSAYSLRTHQLGFLLGWSGYTLMILISLRSFCNYKHKYKHNALQDALQNCCCGMCGRCQWAGWELKEIQYFWIHVVWFAISFVAIPSLINQILTMDYPGYYEASKEYFIEGAPNPFGFKSAYTRGGMPPILETTWQLLNFAIPFIVWLMNPKGEREQVRVKFTREREQLTIRDVAEMAMAARRVSDPE